MMAETFTFKIKTTRAFGEISPKDMKEDDVDVKYVTNHSRNVVIVQGLGRNRFKKRHDASFFTLLAKGGVIGAIMETYRDENAVIKALGLLQQFFKNRDQLRQLPTTLSEWQEFMTNLVLRLNEEFFTNPTYMHAKLSLSTCFFKKDEFFWASIGKNHIFHFDLSSKHPDPFNARLNYPKPQYLPTELSTSRIKEIMECGRLHLTSGNIMIIIASDGLIAIKGGIPIIRPQDLFQIIRHQRAALAAAHSIVKEIKEKRKGTENFTFLIHKP